MLFAHVSDNSDSISTVQKMMGSFKTNGIMETDLVCRHETDICLKVTLTVTVMQRVLVKEAASIESSKLYEWPFTETVNPQKW